MGRPTSPKLTRESIVAVALELIDEGGPAQLTTRGLAARLGVQGPSIYNHFATMDAVADAVVDAVLATVDMTVLEGSEWRAALAAWARSYWRVLHEHPGVIPLLARGVMNLESQLRMADAVYGVLIGAGWSAADAVEAGLAVRDFVLGSAFGSYAGARTQEARDLPNLADALEVVTTRTGVDAASFERGLRALIKGLAAELDASSPSA
jgi:AcrR family transcriptional regulator